MAENERKQRDEIFSRAVRAGKRTYFFDVKSTKSDQYYLTITESKRRFNQEQGKFYYEKHKIFLYKEDFDKFLENLNFTINFIDTGEIPPEVEENNEKFEDEEITDDFSNVDFEDLEGDSQKPKKI